MRRASPRFLPATGSCSIKSMGHKWRARPNPTTELARERSRGRKGPPRGRALGGTGAPAAKLSGASPPPSAVETAAIQSAGRPSSVAVATWPIAVIACRVRRPITARSIAGIAPRAVGVIRPPPASIPIAHVANALTEREIARCGGEIAHRHRRCRGRRDAAERGASHQTDGESSHGTPPLLLLHGVKRAPSPLSLPLLRPPGKVGRWQQLRGLGSRRLNRKDRSRD